MCKQHSVSQPSPRFLHRCSQSELNIPYTGSARGAIQQLPAFQPTTYQKHTQSQDRQKCVPTPPGAPGKAKRVCLRTAGLDACLLPSMFRLQHTTGELAGDKHEDRTHLHRWARVTAACNPSACKTEPGDPRAN